MSALPPGSLRLRWQAWRQRMRAWLAEAMGEGPAPMPGQRRPIIKRGWRYTSLQFTQTEMQSRMLTFRPQALLIGYTRTMMAVLRLRGRPERIAMIGLGGGSMAKYCHRHLPGSALDVVEINPHVVALRRTFRVPDDDARFRIHVDDGAGFLRRHRAHYDVLMVDGYDERGIPPDLSTQRFYDDCRAALREGGAMTLNLYSADAALHLKRIRRAFDDRVMSVQEPGMTNQVVFAWVGEVIGCGEGDGLSAAAASDLAAEFSRVEAALLAFASASRG